jgi:RNA polymerase sigma-70 factor, ECF subfamily
VTPKKHFSLPVTSLPKSHLEKHACLQFPRTDTIGGMLTALERDHEIALAKRLLAGQPEAFEQFVEHFRTKIFQYSWLMCGQREDAEEVAQETLLKAFRSFHQLREPERVRSWIFRVAKNACLTQRRKSLFAPSAAQEISLDALMPNREQRDGRVKLEIADWSQLPEDQALQAEMKRELEKAIRQLPEAFRAIIILRDLQELSTQETAHILEVSEDVVKTRLHRARLAIRKSLDEALRKKQQVEAV